MLTSFSERLKAIHPAVKVLGHFLLTIWQAGKLADENLRTSFKIRYQAKLAAFGYFE